MFFVIDFLVDAMILGGVIAISGTDGLLVLLLVFVFMAIILLISDALGWTKGLDEDRDPQAD
jgi:hypothetical protein